MPAALQPYVRDLLAQIEAQLEALPDPKAEPVRRIRRDASRKLIKAPPRDVLALALKLLVRGGWPQRCVAYELVSHHKSATTSLGQNELERLGKNLDSWAAVDTFACYLSGPAWRDGQIPDALVHQWARSPDRWWRRASLVSTVPLSRAGQSRQTLRVCRMLSADRDDMVVKALSWALRELAKRDPEAVVEFLARYSKILAARVLREVRNKLATGLKNPKNVRPR
jgi:3-methyladenine DNA glycosylase AlkD